MDLTFLQYLYIGAAAFLIGFTKTSVGGVGILAVLLVALAIPGKTSPGVLLPMLIAADVMAVVYYRRSCRWGILKGILPLAVVGVVVGTGILWSIPAYNFEKMIGWIILSMLAFDLALTDTAIYRVRGRVLTALTGTVAGAASMMANAAGPIFGIYMLRMGLKKNEFVGTRSFFFLLMNISKLPFSAGLGLITTSSLSLNAMYIPVILLGAFLGKIFLTYLNVGVFKIFIRVAVLITAVRLILF